MDCIFFLCYICRLIDIGVEFCGEGSASLQDSMRQQSLMYFKNYHRYKVCMLKVEGTGLLILKLVLYSLFCVLLHDTLIIGYICSNFLSF